MVPTKLLALLLTTLSIFSTSNSKSVKQDEESINKLEEYIEEAKKNINPRYRLSYHVAGPVGWINDPNGFSYYKGKFHLFFQYYPYDSKWGPMHWGHVTSEDLVTWEYQPTALVPEEEMCFSGTAVVDGDRLVLIYTGRLNLGAETFKESQYLAFSDDGVKFEKYKNNPVLADPPNGSPDFRDPKAWRHGDYWYVVIGSTTEDKHGRVLLYRSSDLYEWEYLNVLGESNGTMGYMWECPDFFQLNGKYVLLMSPQGLEPHGDRYKNLYQTGYIIGDFSYDTFEFTPTDEFKELDFGHDFYAATTTEKDGKRFLVAWFAMWEQDFQEAEDGWSGAMTIIRELKLDEHNRITMEPVTEMESLREESEDMEFESGDFNDYGNAVELLISGSIKENVDIMLEGQDGGEHVKLTWNPELGKVTVNRNDGDVRQVEWEPKDKINWRIFLDTSSVELFCGGGEVVFSTRVYSLGGWRMTNESPQNLQVTAYNLKRAVPMP